MLLWMDLTTSFLHNGVLPGVDAIHVSPRLNVQLIVGCIIFLIISKLYLDTHRPILDHIPTIGHSGRLTSYISAFKVFTQGRQIFQEGYSKYPKGIFKVPTLNKWEFIIGGGELVEDLRRAGSEELSFHQGIVDNVRLDYTVKSNIMKSTYHLKVIGTKFVPFAPLCDDMHDECIVALQDLIPATNLQWTRMKLWSTCQMLAARMGNRVFVGVPLCRNLGYLDLCIGFAINIMKAAALINMAPKFLHPIVGPLLSPYEKHQKLGLRYLGPLIQERIRMKEEHGDDWEGKPDDLVSWLVDEAQGEDAKIENLAMRILFVNLASIHITSMAMTHVLFNLAARTEYIEPLRAEAQEITESGGWSKSAVAKLYKLDSFIRECIRYSSLNTVAMVRKVVDPKGFKFSNGITLPCGNFVSVISDAMHHDPAFYPDPYTFDGYRFYKLGKGCLDEGNETEFNVKHAFTSMSPNWLLWGLGRHACPGRFFAAHQIRATVAYVLLNYDIRLGGGRELDSQWGPRASRPDPEAHLLFRQRSGH